MARIARLSGERLSAWLLNLPALGLIGALMFYPVGVSLWISLHRYNLRRPDHFQWIGLGNYIDIVTSRDFWHSLEITLYFTGLSVGLVILIALGVALLFNQDLPGRGLMRSLLLVPWAVPGIVNGLMWQGLLSKYGTIDSFMKEAVSLCNTVTESQLDYLGLASPGIALNAAIAAHVWRSVPFACIVFLSALQAIPDAQYSAARVDGGGDWSCFQYITLPWLTQPIMIVAIFETMNGFRAFDLIFTLTGGGPGDATHVIAWQTYKEAFARLNFGRANAYSYLIALFTMGLSIIYIRLLYRRGEIQS